MGTKDSFMFSNYIFAMLNFLSKLLKIDLVGIFKAAHFVELTLMDLGHKIQKIQSWSSLGFNLGLCILWYVIHFIITIWSFAVVMFDRIESYLISSGFIKRYKVLNTHKVKYLAIVVDSEEARQIHKVIELLQWLKAIGMKNICLYDADGVLKNSKESIMKSVNAKLFKEASETDSCLDQGKMTLEFASVSDGKEAVAKAANELFKKYDTLGNDQQKPIFTEPDLTEALKTLGYGGPEPDLLFIYAHARCHLGFPPWRTRYTEFVHMGTLKSMNYGSLIKAIYKFTRVHQNYGT